MVLSLSMLLTMGGCKGEDVHEHADATPTPVVNTEGDEPAGGTENTPEVTEAPTEVPVVEPTAEPTVAPTATPKPTATPEPAVTPAPTAVPTPTPTPAPACEHKNERFSWWSEPTCTQTGTKNIYCADCNVYLRTESVPTLEHEFEYNLGKPATCISGAWYKATCKNCGRDGGSIAVNETFDYTGTTKVYNVKYIPTKN